MSALGSLLREPNWRNLEEAGRLITVGGNELVYNEAQSSVSNEDLDKVLGKFVAEVRKEGRKKYRGKTLYELICCIQANFRIERKRNISLVGKKGCNFRNLNCALNFQMKQRASAGVGVDVKQANVIS